MATFGVVEFKVYDNDQRGDLKRLLQNDEERKRKRLQSLEKLKEEKGKQEEKAEAEKKEREAKQEKRDKIMETYVKNVKSGLSELQEAMRTQSQHLSEDRKKGQREAQERLKELVEVEKSLVQEQKANNRLFERLVEKL